MNIDKTFDDEGYYPRYSLERDGKPVLVDPMDMTQDELLEQFALLMKRSTDFAAHAVKIIDLHSYNEINKRDEAIARARGES